MKLTAEWTTLPREGEEENGDTAVFRRDGDRTLLGVIDALGHGAPAAAAAGVAAKYLAEARLEAGLRAVVEGLHESLRGTRGAAAMLLLVDGARVEGVGVGNVDLRCQDMRLPAVLSPGILGAQLARLRLFEGRLERRGRVVIFSDGLSSRLLIEDVRALAPRDACRALMDRHRRPGDDATVLVTDFED